MVRTYVLFAGLFVGLTAASASAQGIDCANAMAQQELNQCAYADWEVADSELNAAYSRVMALLKAHDTILPAEDRGAAEALRMAQRAWISFRDLACASEGYAMKGGSAEPLLVYGCMAQLTQERTGHLILMAAAYEG